MTEGVIEDLKGQGTLNELTFRVNKCEDGLKQMDARFTELNSNVKNETNKMSEKLEAGTKDIKKLIKKEIESSLDDIYDQIQDMTTRIEAIENKSENSKKEEEGIGNSDEVEEIKKDIVILKQSILKNEENIQVEITNVKNEIKENVNEKYKEVDEIIMDEINEFRRTIRCLKYEVKKIKQFKLEQEEKIDFFDHKIEE